MCLHRFSKDLTSSMLKLVSIELYPCFCSPNNLKRFTSKKTQRSFVRCGSDRCNLLVPEERYNELMDAYENKVSQCFKPFKFPECDCDQVASLWVSGSTSNPGRPYFRCQDTSVEYKCEFFRWADNTRKRKKRNANKDISSKKMNKCFKRVQFLASSDNDDKQ